MSYQTCTAALLTLIRAYNSGATFTTATSAENDWRMLNQSAAARVNLQFSSKVLQVARTIS